MPITKINEGITMDVVNEMKTGKEFTGVKTGYIDLDYALEGGLEKGKLYLMAGRPAMGKTAFATCIALNAMKAGQKVVYASGELSREKLIERMIKTDARLIKHLGNYTEEEMTRMTKSANFIGQSSLVIDDDSAPTLENIIKDNRSFYQDADLIIIDCLQFMYPSREMHGSCDSFFGRDQELICKALHTYARENNVAILLLSQMNRNCEARADHRPLLGDLRHPVDMYADVVMFLYRDEYYDHETTSRGIAEIHIAKNNNGKVCYVDLAWIPECLTFASL